MSIPSPVTHSESSILSDRTFFDDFAGKRSWEPGWFADFRKENWEKACKLASPLKDERWRFSQKSRLGFSNVTGLDSTEESVSFESSDPGEGVCLRKLDKVILEEPDLLGGLQEFSGPGLGADESFHFARAFSEAGFYLRAKRDVQVKEPLFIEHNPGGENLARFHLNLIELEPCSSLTLIERLSSSVENSNGFFTNLTLIKAGEGSRIERILIQELNGQSTFHNLENFEVCADAHLSNVAVHLGSAQTRVESKGCLSGEGAEFDLSSLTLGRGKQLFDQRTMQHHLAPNGKSSLTFKNALLDQAKSVFSGLIKVENEAGSTNAFQSNRNLLLSDTAKADSLPGLEILANDVKCSHGATTSKIDEQELFYLLSRGIPRSTAERLIVLGFFEEVIEKIRIEDQLESVRESISKSFDT